MAAYNAPVPLVDPIETQIHLHFNQMVYCVNQRREAVLTMYRDLRQEIDSRPLVRARRELELTALRTETDNAIQMNQNRQLQQRILPNSYNRSHGLVVGYGWHFLLKRPLPVGLSAALGVQ